MAMFANVLYSSFYIQLEFSLFLNRLTNNSKYKVLFKIHNTFCKVVFLICRNILTNRCLTFAR
jgi:hypothetical protein